MPVRQILLFVILTACVVAFALAGCASKQVLKIDKDVALFMKDNTLSVDCKAGIADAAILAPDTGADVRIAAQAVGKYVDKDKSQEYKDCFAKTAFFSFSIRGGADEVAKVAAQISTLGVLP